jgi:hypothetical protein
MPTLPIRVLASTGLGAALVLAAALVSSTARAQVVGGVVADPDATPRSLRCSGEIGVVFGVVPGVAGGFANPGLQLTPGLSLAVGERVRWHATFGYSRLTHISSTSSRGLNGIDLRPLTIGFPLHLDTGSSVGFAIEPLIDLVGMQTYFAPNGAAFIFASGVGVQGVLNFKSAYISIAPLNLQFQYAGATTGGNALSGAGFGLNMPVRFSAGARF